MRLAVITTMKYGLDHFVQRELLALESQGISISLYPTKFKYGLYNAQPSWVVHRWNPLSVIVFQLTCFLRAPMTYLQLAWQALGVNALPEMAIAWYLSSRMADADVIYSICGDRKLFIGYFCKQILKKPLAVMLHAYELYRNPNPRLFQDALAACDQIMTVTEYNRELLEKRYGIESSKVEVVRCMVDLKDYRPQRKFVILIVAFFDERKGHEILFKAVKQLGQEDLEVWVVGGTSGRADEPDVPALAREIGVESQVAFFGKLNGVALKAVYLHCDVFCLPCRTSKHGIAEGFPTVLMEAMAFGKPVITTRHVEIPRVVPEILVNENDVEGLAQAIKQMYQSAALRRGSGERNRDIAEELFGMRNAERTARILNGLAGRGREQLVSSERKAEAYT